MGRTIRAAPGLEAVPPTGAPQERVPASAVLPNEGRYFAGSDGENHPPQRRPRDADHPQDLACSNEPHRHLRLLLTKPCAKGDTRDTPVSGPGYLVGSLGRERCGRGKHRRGRRVIGIPSDWSRCGPFCSPTRFRRRRSIVTPPTAEIETG